MGSSVYSRCPGISKHPYSPVNDASIETRQKKGNRKLTAAVVVNEVSKSPETPSLIARKLYMRTGITVPRAFWALWAATLLVGIPALRIIFSKLVKIHENKT